MKKILLINDKNYINAILRYVLLLGFASLLLTETFAQNDLNYLYGGQEKALFASPKLHIYPNPAKANISINLQAPTNEAVRLQVYNLIGQAVAEAWSYTNTTRNIIKMDLNHLPEGVYFVEATASDVKMVQRLIIRR